MSNGPFDHLRAKIDAHTEKVAVTERARVHAVIQDALDHVGYGNIEHAVLLLEKELKNAP